MLYFEFSHLDVQHLNLPLIVLCALLDQGTGDVFMSTGFEGSFHVSAEIVIADHHVDRGSPS
jgi:hypothetical protein